MEYKLVVSQSVEGLEKEVNDKLANGFILASGLVRARIVQLERDLQNLPPEKIWESLIQAMTKG